MPWQQRFLSKISAATVESRAVVSNCTAVNGSTSWRGAKCAVLVMCNANPTAQSSTHRSPGAKARRWLKSSVISPRPAVAIATPKAAAREGGFRSSTAAKTGTITTLKPVMKAALAASVVCRPMVCGT